MKQTEKAEMISLRESLTLFFRGVAFWYRVVPNMIRALVLSNLLQSAAPYVTVWFSARILNELAGGRDAARLTRLVILTLGISCLLSLATAAARRWYGWLDIMGDYSFSRPCAEKLMDMDFSVLDRKSTFALFADISQSRQWNAWGLDRVRSTMETLVRGIAGIGGALALSAGLLTSSVPHRGDWLDGLDHPLVPVGVVALVCFLNWLSGWLDQRSLIAAEAANKDATLGNRVFHYFSFDVPKDRRRQMDIRLYEQAPVCHHYSKAFLTWGWEGAMGRWLRGSRARGYAALRFVQRLTALPIYAYTCLKAWAGAFGVGSATQYISAITALSQGLSDLVSALSEMRDNAPFLRKVYRFFDLPNEMYQGSLTTEKRSDRQYQVEFRDVSFRYPDTEAWALRHVSFSFQVGQRLAVVGENGSGKTTFIKLLCRLYDPTEGEILLNGIDIRKYDYQDYLRLFSVVFQDFQLLPLPLGQNVAAARDYDPDRAADCLNKAGFAHRLAQLSKGLDTCLYRTFDPEGVEVSGGEGQKIALARALYRDAPFIILDEPTAALDPLAEAQVYSQFDQIVGDKTAVYISHRLSSCRFCDRIAVFHQGQVVQTGTHDSLLAQEGNYSSLWHAQAQYYAKQEEDPA